MSDSPIVDFSFVYEVAENDLQYSFELISLYLKTVSAGLVKLEELVRQTDDFEAIHKQAHFLKSSSKIVQVRDMYDNLMAMEALAIEQRDRKDGTGDKQEIMHILDNMIATFRQAEPVLKAEIKKVKAGIGK
jgi:HPt (histidine-containing phosphotransfer) domain-containing protein